MRRWLELLFFAANPLLALAAAPMLARGLGPDGRGAFALAIAVFSLASTLGNFGQAERYAAALRNGRRGEKSSYYIIAGVASVTAAIAAFLVMAVAFNAGIVTALAVATAVPVASFGLIWRAVAVSRARTLLLAFQTGGPAAVRLILLAIAFLASALTPFVATALTLFSTALGVFILWRALMREQAKSPPNLVRRLSVDVRTLIPHLRVGISQGLPIVGFTLCTAIMLRLDVFVLSTLSTPAQVGYYAAAVGITESALAISAAFKNRMQAATYSTQPMRNVRRELIVMIAMVLPAVAVGEAIAHPFTVLMFGDSFEPAVPALRVLILSAVGLMLVDSGQGLLAVLGLRRPMLHSSAAGAAVTLGCLWLLVPAHGALGAAIASLLAYTMVGSATWLIATKRIREL
ncbi:polysaccharide biosynthesis C-terminal domain-containing protein [Mycolicibacterium austroafricanum]|uniref:polysaccharide biosynthesis C-terminal domain-containing protein n=1 Tax=Mycolicibacterium austroafricanum TaxID=39687 RepID=UPI001ABF85E8|nr:polysaccharide biosynthesis C-terminal domain-containing protein [Mycolicibacterium austroafricanum]QRZ08334.1 polysaccharide biosynthesis C-terminal domain-containing protein [Mycolicibacterium austroafricanum]QZT69987.1 polysaccharide biosynthesis C-terminal domain-containing protein [Mycolicibacterium austroafricanum]